jgi:hypothetical protein
MFRSNSNDLRKRLEREELEAEMTKRGVHGHGHSQRLSYEIQNRSESAGILHLCGFWPLQKKVPW